MMYKYGCVSFFVEEEGEGSHFINTFNRFDTSLQSSSHSTEGHCLLTEIKLLTDLLLELSGHTLQIKTELESEIATDMSQYTPAEDR